MWKSFRCHSALALLFFAATATPFIAAAQDGPDAQTQQALINVHAKGEGSPPSAAPKSNAAMADASYHGQNTAASLSRHGEGHAEKMKGPAETTKGNATAHELTTPAPARSLAAQALPDGVRRLTIAPSAPFAPKQDMLANTRRNNLGLIIVGLGAIVAGAVVGDGLGTGLIVGGAVVGGYGGFRYLMGGY